MTLAIRSSFLDFVADPFYTKQEEDAVRWTADGFLVLEDGKIKDFGPFAQVSPRYPGIEVHEWRDKIVMCGFVDTHVHYVQSRVTGAFGKHKPEWLHDYIFPEEIRCKDPEYAREVADFFLKEMLRCGTTTVQTFTTPFPASVQVFFEEASKLNMRVIAGLTGVDREGEGPPGYRTTAEAFERDSKDLYDKWHGKGRNLYAVTPRYAPGVTDDLLHRAGEMYHSLPGVYVNTHIAEPISDTALTLSLFPNAKDYLGVFEMHGLLGPRTTFGHAIWLSDDEFERMSKTGSGISFCPSSNLFLGSGLFKIAKAKGSETPCRVGLGTDMGGGNYFSQIKVCIPSFR
jgi:guanine deaminase